MSVLKALLRSGNLFVNYTQMDSLKTTKPSVKVSPQTTKMDWQR